jgi:hypothetical protein
MLGSRAEQGALPIREGLYLKTPLRMELLAIS